MLLPFQGVLGRYHINPGRCPGLFAFGLSARIISIIVNTFLQSGLKAQLAHSPGYSEAAPWVCMPMIVNALQGQKHNKKVELFTLNHFLAVDDINTIRKCG